VECRKLGLVEHQAERRTQDAQPSPPAREIAIEPCTKQMLVSQRGVDRGHGWAACCRCCK
jgi:hypothetical protein